MGWTEAHRYYTVLRAAEADLNRRGDGVIVWRREYADVFAGVRELELALRTRWATMVEAQVDAPWDVAGRASASLRKLAAEHRGLLLALTRNAGDGGRTTTSAQFAGVA